MSKTSPSELEKFEIKNKYSGLKIKIESDSSFKYKVEDEKSSPPKTDVPIRRFGFINEKIQDFLLKESADNIKLIDFEDGLGKVYAYKWRNEGGWVSFYANFSNDKNIEIPEGSSVSSGCTLFADEGKIVLEKSNLINTRIVSKGSINITKSKIVDCFVYGSLTIDQTDFPERSKFYTSNCTIKESTISGNHLFFQDEVDCSGSILINQSEISGNCELKGSVKLKECNVSGKVKLAGNISSDQDKISDNVYIHAGKNGSINLKENTISNDCIIINSVSCKQSQLSGNILLCDNVSLDQSQVSGQSVILDNAILSQSQVSGHSIINMQSNVSQSQISDNAVMTGKTSITSGSISGHGILAGNGTSCNSCTISGGRVFNGVACNHSVGDGKRHFDSRSCNKEIDTLVDEREGCTSPGASDCKKEQPEPTTC